VVPVRGLRNRSRGSLRVAVASDQRLIAESVAAALRQRSFDTVIVRWPGPPSTRKQGSRRPYATRRAMGAVPDVGIIVTDLLRVEQVRGAQHLVSSLEVPWLVLASAPAGPAWGGLYDRGVGQVLPSDIGLEPTCKQITDLAAGGMPEISRRERKKLIRAWREFVEERDAMTARLRTLSDREEEVLQRLYEGVGVRAIAAQSEVAEATVRSQVKSILRKLDVSSQMAAVLAYEELVTDSIDPDLHHAR
jgi:DNA-binding NarL/FixJ family response regulator